MSAQSIIILHWVAIMASLIGIVIWMVYAHGNPSRRMVYMALVVLYLVNTLLFNVAAEFGELSPTVLNMWSIAIRLYSIFTVSAVGFVLWITRKS